MDGVDEEMCQYDNVVQEEEGDDGSNEFLKLERIMEEDY